MMKIDILRFGFLQDLSKRRRCEIGFQRHAGHSRRLAGLCLLSLIGGVWPILPGGAEETSTSPEPPANPLDVPAEPIPSQSGYFQSTDATLPLQPPARTQIGDFALLTRATLTTVYDDNVEAADDERNEDIFLAFSPSIRAQSLYARHSLGFEAAGTAAEALKSGSEDFFDWRIGADGRVDLSEQRKINAAVGYRYDTEDDESVDAEDDQDDLSFHLFDASLSYNVQGDTLGYSVGSSVSRLDAEGSDFDDRDRTALGVRASTSYAFSDRLSIFAGPSYRYSTFDEDVADDGDGRDAEVISAQIGAGYRASRTISTSASIGYSYAAFDDPDREDDDTAIGNIGLTWSPGYGTTLQLGAGRTLGLTVIDNADARTTTTGDAILSHRLRLGSRSAISSSLSYQISEYSDLDRTDHNIGASLGYGYRLTE
ncbi:MAG: outer membrane beta-barrel protein, partial [Geminicoccaceae bacterium]